MEDNFESINSDNWGFEIQTGGYGNGEFDWTTNDPKNAFVDAEGLHIVPTLTVESTSITEEQLLNGYTLNITKSDGDGSCTSNEVVKACGVRSNSTLGTIIPPVRSARMTTKGKKSIKYGRVEIVAKMAKGDWLWPALCKFYTSAARAVHEYRLTTPRDDARRRRIRRMASLR